MSQANLSVDAPLIPSTKEASYESLHAFFFDLLTWMNFYKACEAAGIIPSSIINIDHVAMGSDQRIFVASVASPVPMNPARRVYFGFLPDGSVEARLSMTEREENPWMTPTWSEAVMLIVHKVLQHVDTKIAALSACSIEAHGYLRQRQQEVQVPSSPSPDPMTAAVA